MKQADIIVLFQWLQPITLAIGLPEGSYFPRIEGLVPYLLPGFRATDKFHLAGILMNGRLKAVPGIFRIFAGSI